MKYTISRYPNENTITLQSIGHVIGEPAKNIKVNDFLMWNFGCKSQVIAIVKETKNFIEITEKSESGYVGNRKIKKQRIICILKNQ